MAFMDSSQVALVAEEVFKLVGSAVLTAMLDTYMAASVSFPRWAIVAGRIIRLATLPSSVQILTTIQALITRADSDDGLRADMLFSGISLVAYLTTTIAWTYFGLVWSIFWKGMIFCILLLFTIYVTPRDITWNIFLTLRTAVARSCVWIFNALCYCMRMSAAAYRYFSHLIMKLNSIYTTNASRDALLSSARPLPYKYQPLDNDQDIRLLQVHRKTPFGKCFCTIVHRSLHTLPVYEAISYTWGDLPRDCELLVDGKVMLVTQNVLDIVKGRASFLDQKALWIDAVCIDQDNADEKSSQVAMMRTIFHYATKVVAWLRYPNFYRAFMSISFISYLKLQLMQNLSDEERRRILRLGSRDLGWQGLFEFFDNPYWRRAWIVQELSFNRNVIVAYGGHCVRLDFIQSLVDELRSTDNKFNSPMVSLVDNEITTGTVLPLGFEQMRTIFNIRSKYQTSGRVTSLMAQWIVNRKCLCSDPRDRLYSLFGFYSSTHYPELKPDYNKTVQEVFTNMARYCCIDDMPLVLGSAGIDNSQLSNTLPSWVPDFNASSDRALFDSGTDTPFAYHATGNSPRTFDLHSSLNVLTTSAIRFDTVDYISEPIISRFDHGRDVVSSSNLLRKQLAAASNFVSTKLGPGPYLNGQPKNEVVWRSMMGDRDISVKLRPLPEKYGTLFNAYFEDRQDQQAFNDYIETSEFVELVSTLRNMSTEDARAFIKQAGFLQIADVFNEIGVRLVYTLFYMFERRLAVTSRGALGMVPKGTKVGDTVCVFSGCSTCWIIRPSAPEDIPSQEIRKFCADGSIHPCRLVGESYMHGFMDGEVLREGREWEKLAIW